MIIFHELMKTKPHTFTELNKLIVEEEKSQLSNTINEYS